MNHLQKAVFLDKDGTLVNDIPFNVDPQLLSLTQSAGEALRVLRQAGYLLLVVSNQPGVAKGYFGEAALLEVRSRLEQMLMQEQVQLHGFYYCPHDPAGAIAPYALSCRCRKPQPGMLLQAAQEHHIDLAASWMIGDILHDVEAGKRAGCRSILIDNGNETEWDTAGRRKPDFIFGDLLAAARMITRIDKLQSLYSLMS